MLNKVKSLRFLPVSVIFLFGLFLRLIRLNIPSRVYFDETYYAAAAKNYLNFTPDGNWVHPPLGKMLISTGILFLGDNPWGWRVPSAVFGSLMIIIIYLLAEKMFKNKFSACCAAALLAICPLSLAQSRIAMLDVYLSFFILAGFYFLYLYIDASKKTNMTLALAMIFFALSLCCKWSGIFAVAGALIILVYHKYFTGNREKKISADFPAILMSFLIVIFTVYLASYIPFFMQKHSFHLFINNHISSIKFHYEPSFKHAYLSHAWSWPFLIRPVWYFFENFSTDKFIGVICMGNPFVWLTFLPIYAYLIIKFFKTRENNLFFIITGYFLLYFPWFISLKGGFFYYLAPAAPFMYLGITYVLNLWWNNNAKILVFLYFTLTVLFFAIFLPVIIAIPVTKAYFYKIMRFKSWI